MTKNTCRLQKVEIAAGWPASLDLTIERRGARSVLAARRHVGPLVVQRPLYPEDEAVCHLVLVHPPGGLAGGDELAVGVEVSNGAHALLTTPAAAKWYRADGRGARQTTHITVAEGGLVEYLPLEAILFEGAAAEQDMHVALDGSAVFAGWDIACLGRRASGEGFDHGSIRQTLVVTRQGRQVWHETALIAAGDPLLASPVGLAGRPVFGTFLIAAGAAPAALVDQARALRPTGAGDGELSALPELVVARYRGRSAEEARGYFGGLWALMRPWYAGRAAIRPRLWRL